MPTVIDSLLVTLGLDTRPYLKGIKQTTEDQRKFKEGIKKTTNDVGESLGALAKTAGALFLGFEGAKGALSYFAGLTVATANLGRFSQNVGVSAHEVNAWGQAVELAGGSASDAQTDLQGLSSSLTNLKATGDVSPMLLLFQRLGVAIYDAQGNTRKLTDIYKDLGDHLKQFNRADAYNLAKQGGLSDSTINLIMKEGTERQKLLDLAEQNNNVNEEAVRKAEELQEEWRGIGQEVKGVGMTILGDITPAVKDAFSWAKSFMDTFRDNGSLSFIGSIFKDIWIITKSIVSGWKQLIDLISGSFIGKLLSGANTGAKDIMKAALDALADVASGKVEAFTGREIPQDKPTSSATPAAGTGNVQGSITDTAKKYGIPENVLRNLIKTESNFDPNAFNKSSGATGIAQLLPKYHPNAGKSATGDIDEAGKTLLEYYRQFGSWELAAAAYNTGPSNLKKELAGAKAIPRETSNYVGKIFGPNDNALASARFNTQQSGVGAPANQPAGGGGGTTTVQIDQVNVHGVNTNKADDVAAALPDAMARKGVVNQVDTGMS